ncbi:PAS domain S-box-containing protein [Mucilaginibacter yixingensis]|uniref:histidine kinase n=1 Tax=Mucilaginibacter yixingensis TaxID=1295612 RepID=A0A2T5J591_9SPHI|nr:PAS domain-containing protein [Mucilaginibacter yixingensis]PTQ92953.1 PAS domain S-box-containing protein [Mucilaginibacter yixingensis]
MIEDKYGSVLFNAYPIPAILLKADHPTYTIVAANDAYFAFTNSSKEEIIGYSLIGFLEAYLEDADKLLPGLQNVLLNKKAHKQPAVKYNFRTPHTNEVVVKYLEVFSNPLLGDDGEVEFILRTISDVTELVEAQQNEKSIHENLLKHEMFLNESQRIAKIGYWEVDYINSIITWSDVLKEIYEVPPAYQPTYETGMAFYKTNEYREIILNAVNESIKHHGEFDIELEIITAAGNVRWLRTTGKADMEDGICVRLYGVTQDITASKAVEKELTDSRNQYQALIESVEGVVWEADADTFEFTYISNKINDLLGYSPEEWLSDPNFWANHIYQGDREWAVTFCQAQTTKGLNHVFDYRMINADGGIVWIKDLVSVIAENGKPKLLRGVMIDITESKLLENLDNLEKNVLEQVANKEDDLQQVLVSYLRGIENLLPCMKCSLLQVKNNKVYTLAAPSLPKDYTDAINGKPIGAKAGSCGTAAFRKEKVTVTDIATDPLWDNYKPFALAHNLRACWSCPIINSDGEVMAVFGMYYGDIKEPGDAEQLVIDRSTAMLKVILENRQGARIIEETTMLMTQGQELAKFGNWQWDIQNNEVKWSDELYNIYGVDKKVHVATYESYMAMLHTDDREPVRDILFKALNTHEDIVFEERIIRPDGETRHLKSWGRVLCDSNGQPEKMIGSCLDITAAKIAESQLWEIAWMQSHLVRGPLARLMGLVGLLQEEQQVSKEIEGELLDYIMTTAHELDKVVRDISNRTVTQPI